MSQDSQEIKTIEQWKWSEMQGLELLVSSSSPPYKTNPITTTPQEEGEQHQQNRQEEEKTTMEKSGESSADPAPEKKEKDSGSSSGNGGGKSEGISPVGFGELFRFADGLDYVLMTIGSVGAIVHGCSLPLFLRFFADLVNSFGSNANNVDKMMQEVLKVCDFSLPLELLFPKLVTT